MELYKISSPARAPRGDIDTHGLSLNLSPLLPSRRRTSTSTRGAGSGEGAKGGRNLITKDSVGQRVDFSSLTGEYLSSGGGEGMSHGGDHGGTGSGGGGGGSGGAAAAESLMIEHPTTFRCE